MQSFMMSDEKALVINMPPRFGKSRTTGCFVEWVLGGDNTKKIMTGSYNETLSTTFSKGVRDTINEEKADNNKIVYSDIFPDTKIKRGDGAMNLWSLENGYNNYLATSPSGTATGFGADLLIIDDLIKNSEEANNENLLDKHWSWFTDTMLSRLEEGGKIIIVMTRWATNDLCGKCLEYFEELGWKFKHICMKAMSEEGEMLCEEILSRQSYEDKKKLMGVEIFNANYQQTPIDIKGRLYTSFKYYTELPHDSNGNTLGVVKAYTDTADMGSDYLASIVYLEYNHEAYILDILYTKEGMEITEPKTAYMFDCNNVSEADIESNNGGRGFARNVQRLLKEKIGNYKTVVRWFSQTANKQSRILSNSAWIMEHVYFPVNAKDRWSEAFLHLLKYQKEGKNAHDDIEDCLTGVAEKVQKGGSLKVLK